MKKLFVEYSGYLSIAAEDATFVHFATGKEIDGNAYLGLAPADRAGWSLKSLADTLNNEESGEIVSLEIGEED